MTTRDFRLGISDFSGRNYAYPTHCRLHPMAVYDLVQSAKLGEMTLDPESWDKSMGNVTLVQVPGMERDKLDFYIST